MFSTDSAISRAVCRSVPLTSIPAVSPETPPFSFGSPRTPARNPACPAPTRREDGRNGQGRGRKILLRDRLDVGGGDRADLAQVRLFERRVVQRGLVEADVAGQGGLRLEGEEEVGLRGG